MMRFERRGLEQLAVQEHAETGQGERGSASRAQSVSSADRLHEDILEAGARGLAADEHVVGVDDGARDARAWPSRRR